MGICSSCEATTVAAATSTAKLVLRDGKLQEFAWPVKAAHVLQDGDAADCFLCSADDMEFDDFVAPVGGDDELQPGQLYFLLPLSMLRRRLSPDEMAALAVKASAALMGDCRCQGGAAPAGGLLFPDASEEKPGGPVAVPEQQRRRRRGAAAKRGRGRGRDFEPELSGIAE